MDLQVSLPSATTISVNAVQLENALESIFDAGTFVELGAYSRRDNDDLVGVVCGYGAVNGKLVFAFSQDSSRKKGAFDDKQAKKIVDMEEAEEKALANIDDYVNNVCCGWI